MPPFTGIATEPEALRDGRLAADAAGLRALRDELRAFLRAALRRDGAAELCAAQCFGVAATTGVAFEREVDESVDQLAVAQARVRSTASGTSRSA